MSMIEDRILVWQFNRGDAAALCRIYEKHRDALLRVAAALLVDHGGVEDVFHDVFVDFARSAGRFRLSGSLRGFLSVCVANRARDMNRSRQRRPAADLAEASGRTASENGPEQEALARERAAAIESALMALPDEQREVLVLHLQGWMTFRQIAELREISVNTAVSRYRYGLQKVRSALEEKESHV